SLADLKKFRGIGEAKAITIIASLELGRRRKESKSSEKTKIESAKEAADFLRAELTDLNHEQFWVIFLKRNNEVIRKELISRGGVSGTIADAKLIFKRALEETASGIILAHNHPSGALKPSEQDVKLTKNLLAAGKTLGISVLDHLIMTDSSFYSFRDNNLI
ncbi:MAG: DNA repair protein RadC, partial [Bacteroidota bacterium]